MAEGSIVLERLCLSLIRSKRESQVPQIAGGFSSVLIRHASAFRVSVWGRLEYN